MFLIASVHKMYINTIADLINNFQILLLYIMSYVSRDSVVGRATGYGLNDREVGVRSLVEARIFSSPNHPDRIWDPPSFLSNGYRGSFAGGKAAGV
jgi:hypothetical protein